MQAVENLEDVFRDPPARDRMGGAVDYESAVLDLAGNRRDFRS